PRSTLFPYTTLFRSRRGAGRPVYGDQPRGRRVGTVGAECGDRGEAARAGRRGGDRLRARDGGGLAWRAPRGTGGVGCVGRDRSGGTPGHLDLLRLSRSREDRRRGGGSEPHAAARAVGRARRYRGPLSRAQRRVPP